MYRFFGMMVVPTNCGLNAVYGAANNIGQRYYQEKSINPIYVRVKFVR